MFGSAIGSDLRPASGWGIAGFAAALTGVAGGFVATALWLCGRSKAQTGANNGGLASAPLLERGALPEAETTSV